MPDYTVYIHTNKMNGMKYVGITSQKPETRWLSGYGYYKQPHFFRAIKKYGWDGFTHEIIASGLSFEEAGKLEAELIQKYDTRNNKKGYNKSSGGEAGAAGVEKSETQRKCASNVMRTLWKNPEFKEANRRRLLEMNKREDIREKRAAANHARGMTEETRRKISENRRGIKTGPFTEEHKARIKANHAGGAEKVPVICVETGMRYESINDAVRETGATKRGISACCRKLPHYNTAGGFHWQYVEA